MHEVTLDTRLRGYDRVVSVSLSKYVAPSLRTLTASALFASGSDNMFEILIRIESLCSDSTSAALLICGLLALILGILLWLAGLYLSGVILALLGAVSGVFCGWLVSGRLNTSVFAGMAIGVFVFTIVFVVFRNVVMIFLTALVFALSGGTAYAGLILNDIPSPEAFAAFNTSIVRPFSETETSSRQACLNPIGGKNDSFSDRLHRFSKETVQAVSLHQWEIILVVFLGGIVGLLLSWVFRRPIMAVCFSGVGTLLVLVGLEVALLAMNVHLISWFRERQAMLTILYLSLVGAGVIFQFVLLNSSHRKKLSHKG